MKELLGVSWKNLRWIQNLPINSTDIFKKIKITENFNNFLASICQNLAKDIPDSPAALKVALRK